MARIIILDNVDTPQRFDLTLLAMEIRRHLGDGASNWEIERVEGYGLALNSLATEIEKHTSVRLHFDELLGVVQGVTEWLYWFEAVSMDQSARFGLTDSSFMFVQGPSALVESVAAIFTETRCT